MPIAGGGDGGDGIRFGNDPLMIICICCCWTVTGLGTSPRLASPHHKPKSVTFLGYYLMSLYLTKLRLATFTEDARAESGV
jgi:hypothetical protein